MFKNILIAIIIVAALTYGLGHLANEWFGMHIVLDGHNLDASSSVLAVIVTVAVLVIVGIVIAFSIVAAVAFAILAAALGILVAGVSVFWPIIVVGMLIVWLFKDKKETVY